MLKTDNVNSNTTIQQEDKKERVEKMFNSIAPKYDLLNHLLSFGIDNNWRKKVAKSVKEHNPTTILDLATGTGDLLIALHRKMPECKIVGADLSEEMVKVGIAKLKRKGIDAKMMVADAENLPFQDSEFEALTCAFGVRNFGNLEAGLSEMKRVVAEGGKIAILEYSRNQRKNLWTALFNLYFKRILPFIGGIISRNRAAYQYLPDSVEGFCTNDEFLAKLTEIGFINCQAKSFMGGIVTLFTANTPSK